MLLLEIIARLVRRNSKQPGLKLAIALKSTQVLDHREKYFLTDFLHIFPGEIVSELENKPGRRLIMSIEQDVPRFRMALQAPLQQFSFASFLVAHGLTQADCNRTADILAIAKSNENRFVGCSEAVVLCRFG